MVAWRMDSFWSSHWISLFDEQAEKILLGPLIPLQLRSACEETSNIAGSAGRFHCIRASARSIYASTLDQVNPSLRRDSVTHTLNSNPAHTEKCSSRSLPLRRSSHNFSSSSSSTSSALTSSSPTAPSSTKRKHKSLAKKLSFSR